jgi:hypothetical protein
VLFETWQLFKRETLLLTAFPLEPLNYQFIRIGQEPIAPKKYGVFNVKHTALAIS